MDLDLAGKVALVTGAGRGIGRAIALEFAKEGAYVVVDDIDAAAARGVADEISSLNSRSLAVEADVTKMDQVEKMISLAVATFGKIDILVNNAGIFYEPGGPLARKLFEESRPEEWRREIDLILYGALNCIRMVLNHMIRQKSGRIVNISSDQGVANTGVKGMSIYSTAKGGLLALTRAIAAEVAAHGITVNTVSPGLVRTTRAMLAEKQRDTNPEQYHYYKELQKLVVAGIPLGRIGEPEDISKLVVFLASDAARWITGQNFIANGGHVML
jgi:NAD(P)-dependent dehydrogenase (short-subunit alcohol dehydrogenase family)